MRPFFLVLLVLLVDSSSFSCALILARLPLVVRFLFLLALLAFFPSTSPISSFFPDHCRSLLLRHTDAHHYAGDAFLVIVFVFSAFF